MSRPPLNPKHPEPISNFISAAYAEDVSSPLEFVRNVLRWRYIRLSMDLEPRAALRDLAKTISTDQYSLKKLLVLLTADRPSLPNRSFKPARMFNLVVQIPAPNDAPDTRCVEKHLPKDREWTKEDWEEALARCAKERARG